MINEVQQVDRECAYAAIEYTCLSDMGVGERTLSGERDDSALVQAARIARERMEREVVQPLREALVEAAIPLEAMVISGSITRLPHALHAGVHDALSIIRPIINKLADLMAKEMKHNRAAQAETERMEREVVQPLRDRVAELEAALPEWRVIDSAPKDEIILVRFDNETADERSAATAWWNNGIWAGGQVSRSGVVTHWMPLPDLWPPSPSRSNHR